MGNKFQLLKPPSLCQRLWWPEQTSSFQPTFHFLPHLIKLHPHTLVLHSSCSLSFSLKGIIYLAFSLSVCLSIYLLLIHSSSIYLCINLSICAPLYVSVYLSIHPLPVYLFMHYLSVFYLCIYLSIPFTYLPFHSLIHHLSIYLSNYPLIYVSMHPFMYLSTYPSINSSIIYQSIYAFIYVYVSIQPSMYLSIHLSTHRFLYLSLHSFTYSSIYASITHLPSLTICVG